jgi:hypothetical protein
VPGASSNIFTRAVSFQVRLARHLIQQTNRNKYDRGFAHLQKLERYYHKWSLGIALILKNNAARRDRKNSIRAKIRSSARTQPMSTENLVLYVARGARVHVAQSTVAKFVA